MLDCAVIHTALLNKKVSLNWCFCVELEDDAVEFCNQQLVKNVLFNSLFKLCLNKLIL